MISFKKAFILILVSLSLLLPFAACAGGANREESEETGATSEAEKIIIASDRFTDYKIIRPEDGNVDNQFLAAFLEIKRVIDQGSGSSIKLGEAFRRTEVSYKADAPEILIGNTGYPESIEVMNSIGYYDFAIRKAGKKIVIAAHTKENLISACEYFASRALLARRGDDNKAEVVYTGDYTEVSGRAAFFSGDNKLSDYTIVYPAGQSKEYAEQLAKYLANDFKIELNIVADSADEKGPEILIGDTNRAESAKYMREVDDNMTQIIKLEGDKIVLAGKSNFALMSAVSTLARNLGDKKYSFLCNLPSDFDIRDTAFPATDSRELASGANLRIMSYNILSEEWNDKTPIDGRRDYVAATILYYSPDVIGLQEISDIWYSALPGMISSDYVMVGEKNSRGESNYTGMAYNKHKVALLESGTDLFSAGNSTRLRLINWGYYEKLDTKERFIVMNTHWCIVKENRIVEAVEMAALYNKYKDKYNCPIITVGDYNANEGSEEYKNYISLTGLNNARHDADVKKRLTKTTHSLGKAPTADHTAAIDHIFYSDDIKCLYYNTLVDQIVLDSSDHNPIYADFKFD